MNQHEKRRSKKDYWQLNLNECYEILKPIAFKLRYNSNICSDKYTPSKGTIVKSTIQHVIFLESALTQILKRKKPQAKRSSQPKTLEYYQDLFAKELCVKLKVPVKEENYYKDKRSAIVSFSPCGQWTEIPSQDVESPVLQSVRKESWSFETPSPNKWRIFSNKNPESPKTTVVTESKIDHTEKSKVEFKPKCVKSLACQFENETNPSPNQIQEFEGYHCFYKTITELLENVIPLSLATSDCVNHFIANLWSQLSSQERTVYECMAIQGSTLKENQIEDVDFGISQFDPFPDFNQLGQFEQLMEA